jgi:hypothetical protein
MNGIINFLTFIDNNWTCLVIIIGLAITLYKKLKFYIPMTDEEKIELAMESIRSVIEEKVAKAEVEWADYKKTGYIKKSQVISELYTQFPILSKYVNQDELVTRIEELIDEALVNINKTINENNLMYEKTE